jgi:hypothetical protein
MTDRDHQAEREVLDLAFKLSAGSQYRIAYQIAENVGYILTPGDTSHPDDPHTRQSPASDAAEVEVYDRAWDAVLRCPDLKRARERLSIHEIRLIIRAAITGDTAA